MCPLYVAGLIGPGERKSVKPMAERLAPGDYDQLHHFVSSGFGMQPRSRRNLRSRRTGWVGGPDAVLPRQNSPFAAISLSPGLGAELRARARIPRFAENRPQVPRAPPVVGHARVIRHDRKATVSPSRELRSVSKHVTALTVTCLRSPSAPQLNAQPFAWVGANMI
jgi:DDE superfamily endonuclease